MTGRCPFRLAHPDVLLAALRCRLRARGWRHDPVTRLWLDPAPPPGWPAWCSLGAAARRLEAREG